MSSMPQAIACIQCGAEMSCKFVKKEFSYFFCPCCGQVTTYPYPSVKDIQSHYEQGFRDQNYNVVLKNRDVYAAAMKRLCGMVGQDLKRRVKQLEGMQVLDIGCFIGDFLSCMAEKGCSVYGLELQKEAVTIASQSLPGRVFQADVMEDNLALPVREFDMVTMLGLVEHVIQPIKLIQRLKQLLKLGGFLVVQTPDTSSILAKLMQKSWPPFTPVEHIHLFSRKSLTDVLKKMGFKDITVQKHRKVLTIKYVYEMLSTFGPELHALVRPLYRFLPDGIKRCRLPFYIGEMVVIARKANN